MMYALQGTCDHYTNPEDNTFVFLGVYQSSRKLMQAVHIFEQSGYHDFIANVVEVAKVKTNQEVI